MSVTWRSAAVTAVGLLVAAVALHYLQLTFAGHELVRVVDGHGFELLALTAVSPSPVSVLALAVVLTIALVRRVALAQLLAARLPLVCSEPISAKPTPATVARRASALSRHVAERAPPHLAR